MIRYTVGRTLRTSTPVAFLACFVSRLERAHEAELHVWPFFHAIVSSPPPSRQFFQQGYIENTIMGQSTSKYLYNEATDWPYVWALRDGSVLDWNIGLNAEHQSWNSNAYKTTCRQK